MFVGIGQSRRGDWQFAAALGEPKQTVVACAQQTDLAPRLCQRRPPGDSHRHVAKALRVARTQQLAHGCYGAIAGQAGLVEPRQGAKQRRPLAALQVSGG